LNIKVKGQGALRDVIVLQLLSAAASFLQHVLALHQCTFLRATAGTAIARLSHRNSVRLSVRLSVRPSVRHTGGSGKNGAS